MSKSGESGRFARSVTLRGAIALAAVAAVVGAVIALSASYLLLPGRTVAVIEKKRDRVAQALDLPTMGSDLETEVSDTRTAVDDLETQVPDLVWEAIEGDPDRLMGLLEQDPQRLREIVNEGGPTTADLCSALDLSSNPDVNDVSLYGC